jgi:hypothetical protein
MKKPYLRPALVEYGQIGELTLGASSGVPDLDINLNNTNTSCPTEVVNGQTRLACIVATSGNI